MSIYKVTVIDGQGKNLPAKVRSEIRELWSDHSLGNDDRYFSWDEEYESDYPDLTLFIADQGIEGRILIHFWW